MAFPPKQQPKAKSSKNRTQQSQDLEQYWRTGKKPTGFDDESDETTPDTGAQGADGDTDQPLPADDPTVVYMGPESGPFQCGNCMYFVGDAQPCQKVSDPVQSDGCCNLFQSAGTDEGQSDDAGFASQGAPTGQVGTKPSNAAF